MRVTSEKICEICESLNPRWVTVKKQTLALPRAGVCLKIIERAVLLCFLDVFDDGVDDELHVVVGDPWAAREA